MAKEVQDKMVFKCKNDAFRFKKVYSHFEWFEHCFPIMCPCFTVAGKRGQINTKSVVKIFQLLWYYFIPSSIRPYP